MSETKVFSYMTIDGKPESAPYWENGVMEYTLLDGVQRAFDITSLPRESLGRIIVRGLRNYYSGEAAAAFRAFAKAEHDKVSKADFDAWKATPEGEAARIAFMHDDQAERLARLESGDWKVERATGTRGPRKVDPVKALITRYAEADCDAMLESKGLLHNVKVLGKAVKVKGVAHTYSGGKTPAGVVVPGLVPYYATMHYEAYRAKALEALAATAEADSDESDMDDLDI